MFTLTFYLLVLIQIIYGLYGTLLSGLWVGTVQYTAQLFDKKSYDKLWHLYNGQISAPTHRWSPVEGPQTFHVGFWLSPDISNKYAYCSWLPLYLWSHNNLFVPPFSCLVNLNWLGLNDSVYLYLSVLKFYVHSIHMWDYKLYNLAHSDPIIQSSTYSTACSAEKIKYISRPMGAFP